MSATRATEALAVTWWGHSSCTVEIDGVRIGTDPLLTDRLMHLRRHTTTPPASAGDVDLVLVSHLHGDHLHVPSLRRTSAEAPIIVPRGASRLLSSLSGRTVIEVEPGDRLQQRGLDIEVLAAHHDGRRRPLSRIRGPALGFRVSGSTHSFWYPGDTGPDPAMKDVAPVDLALVPIGGWGPTLGDQHMGPDDAVEALRAVGARWAVPVHHGTFWPVGLRTLHRANHHRLFVTPGPRFVAALTGSELETEPVLPAHGERVLLVDGTTG